MVDPYQPVASAEVGAAAYSFVLLLTQGLIRFILSWPLVCRCAVSSAAPIYSLPMRPLRLLFHEPSEHWLSNDCRLLRF